MFMELQVGQAVDPEKNVIKVSVLDAQALGSEADHGESVHLGRARENGVITVVGDVVPHYPFAASFDCVPQFIHDDERMVPMGILLGDRHPLSGTDELAQNPWATGQADIARVVNSHRYILPVGAL